MRGAPGVMSTNAFAPSPPDPLSRRERGSQRLFICKGLRPLHSRGCSRKVRCAFAGAWAEGRPPGADMGRARIFSFAKDFFPQPPDPLLPRRRGRPKFIFRQGGCAPLPTPAACAPTALTAKGVTMPPREQRQVSLSYPAQRFYSHGGALRRASRAPYISIILVRSLPSRSPSRYRWSVDKNARKVLGGFGGECLPLAANFTNWRHSRQLCSYQEAPQRFSSHPLASPSLLLAPSLEIYILFAKSAAGRGMM